MGVIVVFGAVVVIIMLLVVSVVWADTRVKGYRAVRRQLSRYDELVDQLRTLAQEYDDTDPFAALILEEIRAFHRRNQEHK